MFMSAENKMLWAVADTLNQNFKPSTLIGNESPKQARLNSTETMGESSEIKFKVPNAPIEQMKPVSKNCCDKGKEFVGPESNNAQQCCAVVKTRATLVLVGHSNEERNGSVPALHLWQGATRVGGDREVSIKRPGWGN